MIYPIWQLTRRSLGAGLRDTDLKAARLAEKWVGAMAWSTAFISVSMSALKTALSSPLFKLGAGHFNASMTTSLATPPVTNCCQCDAASA